MSYPLADDYDADLDDCPTYIRYELIKKITQVKKYKDGHKEIVGVLIVNKYKVARCDNIEYAIEVNKNLTYGKDFELPSINYVFDNLVNWQLASDYMSDDFMKGLSYYREKKHFDKPITYEACRILEYA